MAKKQKKQKKHEYTKLMEPEVTKNELVVEIFGVTMILPEQKQVVIPNGVKGRLSMDKLSAIAPHIAFIAFEPDKYELLPDMKPAFSFSYDLVGDGVKETDFDGFLLDHETVSFQDIAGRTTKFSIDNIPTTTALSKDIEICPGVVSGNSTKVIATIDLSRAKSIKGADHGNDKLPVTFGTETKNWAEKIVAEFDRNGGQPRVILEKKESRVECKLKDDATRIMIGNVPPQELMKLNALEAHVHDQVPLAHLELLYDLFHMPCGCDVPAAPTTNAPTHAGGPAQLPGTNRCGPPVQG
jgi:hypothetical protein